MSLALTDPPEVPGRALLWGLALSLALHAVAVSVLSQTEAAPRRWWRRARAARIWTASKRSPRPSSIWRRRSSCPSPRWRCR
ncbi:hypothetical protein ACTTAM_06215 [Rhodobacter capsulatus]|uniref:hypothetical protein n=1 Tax=Rhodobacter capsulatus TaxID=1061 RepID=UPI004025DD45